MLCSFFKLIKNNKKPTENIWLHNEVNSLVKSTAHELSYFFTQIYGLVLQGTLYFKMCYLN